MRANAEQREAIADRRSGQDETIVNFFPSNAVWLSPGRSTCFQACCIEMRPLSRSFFSRVCDVGLWLGAYMSISSKKPFCTRTKKKCPEMRANHNKPNNPQTSQTTRKSSSQTCVSSRETTNQTHKRGRSPNKNTYQKDLPKDTVV